MCTAYCENYSHHNPFYKIPWNYHWYLLWGRLFNQRWSSWSRLWVVQRHFMMLAVRNGAQGVYRYIADFRKFGLKKFEKKNSWNRTKNCFQKKMIFFTFEIHLEQTFRWHNWHCCFLLKSKLNLVLWHWKQIWPFSTSALRSGSSNCSSLLLDKALRICINSAWDRVKVGDAFSAWKNVYRRLILNSKRNCKFK